MRLPSGPSHQNGDLEFHRSCANIGARSLFDAATKYFTPDEARIDGYAPVYVGTSVMFAYRNGNPYLRDRSREKYSDRYSVSSEAYPVSRLQYCTGMVIFPARSSPRISSRFGRARVSSSCS